MAAVTVAALAVSGLLATPAHADTAPIDPDVPTTVTADSLPTAQINGIVWDQAIIGNTVYVAGEFTAARPAGSALGQNEVPRANLMAYDVRTGVMTSFAPDVNGTINAIEASPDGSRLYIGGSFTRVNGATRNRIAALNPSDGSVVTGFNPNANTVVKAIGVTDSAVYYTGNFTSVGGNVRERAAASAVNGTLLPWAPVLNGRGDAIAVNEDGSRVVVGGLFTTVNGSSNPGYGLAMVDGSSAALLPFQTNQVIRNGGANASITSLKSSGDYVYGTGFTFGSGGNLEGTFLSKWDTGDLAWVNDCHGDTYDAFLQGDAVYAAGHSHYCASLENGFPQSSPWTFYRAIAVTVDVNRITPRGLNLGYAEFAGNPQPDLLHWFPEFNAGTYSGASQGPWSVTGNADYMVWGGEFTRVNGAAQQGLARFAVRDKAPNSQGPRNANGAPTLTALPTGGVRVAWPHAFDRDNEYLKYEVIKNGANGSPVYTTTLSSKSADWGIGGPSWVDTSVTPGMTTTYRIRTTDPTGNVAWGTAASISTGNPIATSSYRSTVLADAPLHYWPLDEATGSTAYDWAGSNDLTLRSAGLGVPGAISADSRTATSFTGSSSSWAGSATRLNGPQKFSIEAWFKTSSTAGGTIVAFGSNNSAASSSHDRKVYVDNTGRLNFGVYLGEQRRLISTQPVNDGQWHHVVAGIDNDGMTLYLDGNLIGTRADTTSAENYYGYWRVGGETPWQGSGYLNGQIDEVAIYGDVLSATDVAIHYATGTGTTPPNVEPTAAFDAAADKLKVTANASSSTDPDGTITSYEWNWGDSSPVSTGVTAEHTYAAAGTYTVTLTVTDDSGATATRSKTVSVVENVAPTASFTANVSSLAVAVDASASTDSDGTIASYEWGWGDSSSPSTGRTASHEYTAAGTYVVTLTVVDDSGASSTSEQSVEVSEPPVVQTLASDSFTRASSGTLGAADQGGNWTLAGGNAAFTVDGSRARVTHDVGGKTYTATLPDVSTTDVEVLADFAILDRPVGSSAYLSTIARRVGAQDYRSRLVITTGGSVNLQIQRSGTALGAIATGITVSGGDTLRVKLVTEGTSPTTIKAKVWKVGTPEPAAWNLERTDDTAALQTGGSVGFASYLGGSTGASFTTVVDNFWAGAIGSSGGAMPDPINAAPTASFTSTVSGQVAYVDAAGSSDSDGTIASYSWNWGDDSASGNGVTASHAYAAPGTYTVTLTVTDDDGATATSTASVEIANGGEPALEPIAADSFDRTVSGGWGSALVGGPWTVTNPVADYFVAPGAATMNVPASATRHAYLASVSSSDTSLYVEAEVTRPPAGSVFISAIARRTSGNNDYRARVVVASNGAVNLQLQRQGTTIQAVATGINVNSGDRLRIRVEAIGVGETQLRARVWKATDEEPTTWQASVTDTTASLQAAGHVGVGAYAGATVGDAAIPVVFTSTSVTKSGDVVLVGAD